MSDPSANTKVLERYGGFMGLLSDANTYAECALEAIQNSGMNGSQTESDLIDYIDSMNDMESLLIELLDVIRYMDDLFIEFAAGMEVAGSRAACEVEWQSRVLQIESEHQALHDRAMRLFAGKRWDEEVKKYEDEMGAEDASAK